MQTNNKASTYKKAKNALFVLYGLFDQNAIVADFQSFVVKYQFFYTIAMCLCISVSKCTGTGRERLKGD